jgi:hypothetical protein
VAQVEAHCPEIPSTSKEKKKNKKNQTTNHPSPQKTKKSPLFEEL